MPSGSVSGPTLLFRFACRADVHIEDRVMQIALEKAREDLERKVAMKEEEQRILHLDEIEALRKEFEDGAFVNRQGFWHLSWRCLLCMTKLDDGDRWICSYCKLVSLNIG